MSSPIFTVLKLLRDPKLSNKVILQLVFKQVKAVGYIKLLSVLLGALIVAVSSVIKIPQIKKILQPNSAMKRAELAQGLSRNSVRLETLAQFLHVTYNKQQKNAFVNYGESLLLGVQNTVLLLVLEYYRLRKEDEDNGSNGGESLDENSPHRKSLRKLIPHAFSIVGILGFITKVAPPQLIQLLQLLNIPMSVASKIPQIRKNYKLRSTAHLSEVTVGANVLGSLVRVFTTFSGFKKHRSRDAILLAGYSTSLGLNTVLAAQMYRYRKDKTK
ncbi:hypothetical protein JCM33374_g1729 [Metschnikowia sp. JCM 33374]|nr:hypothetical protein JCM33374_g1729 [Metschnikowia sp. JCM 33374]